MFIAIIFYLPTLTIVTTFFTALRKKILRFSSESKSILHTRPTIAFVTLVVE